MVAHPITAEQARAMFGARDASLRRLRAHFGCRLTTAARRTYSGRLEAGEDLMTIDMRMRRIR